eukprot:gene8098-4196_t
MRLARVLACVLAALPRRCDAIEGYALDRLIITNAVQPPELVSFHLRTFHWSKEFTYDMERVMQLGVAPTYPSGENRTLRPQGIVMLEGAQVDTVFWADAGAG